MAKMPTLTMDRRALFASAAATTAVAYSKGALADTKGNVYEPRGWIGRHKRLPVLDLESSQDYLEGLRIWVNTDVSTASNAQVDRVLKSRGIDPYKDIPLERILENLQDDPLVTLLPAAWLRTQQLMWRGLDEHFLANEDQYLDEMESHDKVGPGSLELNPKMHVPEYTAREIHMQPGGYVGHMFAGHMYHHGTNGFFNGKNYQEETHDARAAAVRTPPDGKVKRVLEFGTGIGQLPMALKRRFPEAETWGIDIGGPMVRYAHMRANQLGLNVNFAQRLAEKSGFDDNYFDIVTSMQFYHECRAQEIKETVAEAHRILRPGGIFYPLDGNPWTRPKSAARTLRTFWTYRWNHEDWMMDWESINMIEEMKKVGFKIQPGTGENGDNIMAIKV